MFVIAGSSGNTGSVVADTLLDRGEQVRLLVRHPHKVAALARRGAEVVVADLEDSAALARAFNGARGAYLLLPPDMMDANVMAMQARVAAAYARALTEAPTHVVFLSSIGAHLDPAPGPVQSLRMAERALTAVCPNVTFLRAAYFMENVGAAAAALPHGLYPTFLRADLPVAMVATRDLGIAAADALLGGPRGRAIIELEGPRRYSALDIAAELGHLLGKPLQVQEAPESAVVPTLLSFGMPAPVAELSAQLFRALNHEQLTGELPAQQQKRGSTTLHELARRLFLSAANAA